MGSVFSSIHDQEIHYVTTYSLDYLNEELKHHDLELQRIYIYCDYQLPRIKCVVYPPSWIRKAELQHLEEQFPTVLAFLISEYLPFCQDREGTYWRDLSIFGDIYLELGRGSRLAIFGPAVPIRCFSIDYVYVS